MNTRRPSDHLFSAIRVPKVSEADERRIIARIAKLKAAMLAEIARQDAAAEARKKGG